MYHENSNFFCSGGISFVLLGVAKFVVSSAVQSNENQLNSILTFRTISQRFSGWQDGQRWVTQTPFITGPSDCLKTIFLPWLCIRDSKSSV